MKDPSFVEEGHAFDNLPEDAYGIGLSDHDLWIVDQLAEIANEALHDQEDVSVFNKDVSQRYDVRVLDLLQNLDLSYGGKVDACLRVDHQFLERNILLLALAVDLLRQVDLSVGSLAYLLYLPVPLIVYFRVHYS